jgi:hypothetical protein
MNDESEKSDQESVNSKSNNGGSKVNKNGNKVKKDSKLATNGGETGGANILCPRNIPIQYDMLTEANYNVWAVKMEIIL